MLELQLTPNDVLFFRDARPMAAGEGYGHGATMPLPHLFYSAVRTGLLRSMDALSEGKAETGGSNRRGARPGRAASTLLCNMSTVGPFLHHAEHGVLLPLPKDVLAIGDTNEEGQKGGKNIRKPGRLAMSSLLRHDNEFLPVSTVPASKGKPVGFWAQHLLQAYLRGDKDIDYTPVKYADEKSKSPVWNGEWRLGIEIDPQRQSTVQGKIYAAEYMRMWDGMTFGGGLKIGKNGEEQAFRQDAHDLIFGGERKLVMCEPRNNVLPSLEACRAEGNGRFLVKWVLLTPAVFRGGSVPGWCLKTAQNDALPNNQVRLWGVSSDVPRAELLTSCVGVPISVSGWDAVDNHPKATLKAVAAGAVYWFLCENAKNANQLIEKLHWQPRSDMFGEKGYGYGVCAAETTDIEFTEN